MATELTSDQIAQLHQRHVALVAEIQVGLDRLSNINEAIETGKLPQGVSFDEIGRPINERP